MSDDIHKADTDEEYQFSETEPAIYTKANPKQAWTQVFANRKTWLVISAVIVAIVIYKLSSVIVGDKEKFPEEIAPTPAIETTQPTASSSVKAPAAQTSTPIDNPFQLDKRLAEVEHHNQQDDARLDKLETKFTTIDADFNQLRGQLSQVQDQLRALTAQLSSLQQQLAKKPEQKAKAKPVAVKPTKKPVVIERPQYYVQAVIPGRAWLVKGDGSSTISVTVGDPLPSYGTITHINPIRASVMTSSGYTIAYKPD